jgi:hypothetical protein
MKIIGFIERRQRYVVEKILRGHQSGAMVGDLWQGRLRTLATARSPPNAADSDQDASEPRELQCSTVRSGPQEVTARIVPKAARIAP